MVEVPQSRRWSTPVVLLVRWHRSLWARRIFAGGSGAALIVLVLLAVRHFETTSWPLSSGHPALLVTAGLLFLLAQALKAYGWGRLFAPNERPKPLALAAANGGAALIGVVLPGRFDDAMRVAVVRRYPGCPAGVRALCLSLVMLGLIDSAALAPLASVGVAFAGAGIGVRAGLGVVAVAGLGATALIVAMPRLAASRRALRFPARPLAEPAHDLAAPCVAGMGARFCVLAGAGGRALSTPGHSRSRLLVLARAHRSLRRRGSSGPADWSCGRRHTSWCRRCDPHRLGRGDVASARCRRFRCGSRGSLRGRRPSLRCCVPERPVALADPGCRVSRLSSAVPRRRRSGPAGTSAPRPAVLFLGNERDVDRDASSVALADGQPDC